MAEISVAQTGAWSDTATWDGGVLPLAEDTISCLGDKTLTVDGDYACAGGLCATGSKIVIAPNKYLELTGLLTMGTSTNPRTSYLELGAGSELKLTGANLQLWACGVTTNGTTKANPAKISGTGSVTASANSGKGYFDCQYLSWILTGTVSVRWGNVASSFPQNSYYKFLNSTFGDTSFDFGSNTMAVSQFIFNNCDFRESTCIFYFLSNSGLSQIRYSTFSAATRKAFTLRSGGATTDFTGTVFNNVTPSVQTKEAANLNFSGMFAALTSAPSGTTLISVEDSDTSGNGVYEDSYFYISTENLRVLNIGATATTSKSGVSHTVERNVLELNVADGGNPIMFGPMRALIRLNLMIGYVLPWASRAYAVGATPYGLEVSRNTQVATAGDIGPALVSFEQGVVAYPGEVDTHSNLTAWTVTPHAETYAALACERSSIVDDSLNLVGHNATFGAGSGPRYTHASIVTDLTANDVILPYAPTFVDPTRNLATWGAAQGADGTVQGAIDLLLAINGYDAATKTQNGTASGVTVPDLVSWVRAGYVPTTSALAGAGYLGVDIGALDVGSSDDTAPVLTDATASAAGPTTATASVTTDDGNGTLYFIASTNATESAATVKAALSQPVTADGAQSISLSALDPETTYYVHFVQINGAGLESASVVSTTAFTTPEVPPVVYPVISATVAASSTFAVSATVTTDTAGGTIYGVLSESATVMTAAAIKSGADDTATVTDAGGYTLNETGLATWTQYFWHTVHEDADGLMSNVLTIPVRTLDISIPLAFSDTAPATLLTVQVWSKLPKKADVEGLY